MVPVLFLSLASLATSQNSFPAFEGFDFSGLSQPQFSLNIGNDETDFQQRQQQLGPSGDFQNVQSNAHAQGRVRQQQQQQFQPQINIENNPQPFVPQQTNQRFLPQQAQRPSQQPQRSFQQQQFGSFQLEAMRQKQGSFPLSDNNDGPIQQASVQRNPSMQRALHLDQPFTAFSQQRPQVASVQQQFQQQPLQQPNFPQPQINIGNKPKQFISQPQQAQGSSQQPQRPFQQQQFPQQPLQQPNFPQTQTPLSPQQQTLSRQQAFPQQQQRFSLQQQKDTKQQSQLPQSQQSSFQQAVQQQPIQQQQSLSQSTSNPSQALFSSPNQFPSRPNIISSPEQPRSQASIFDQIRNSITNGVKFNSPTTFRPPTPAIPTTTRLTTTTTTTSTTTSTTSPSTTTTTTIRTKTTTTKRTSTTTVSSAPIVISSFIEEYEDIESQEVETLPPARKESLKKQNKLEIDQSSVVEEINNIIDLISSFKTVSVQTTTEAPKLIETQERVLGPSDQGESKSQFGDLEFLTKLLISQKERPSDIKPEPKSTTENSLSEKEIDKLLENLLGVSNIDEDDVSIEQEREGESSEIEDDYIDSVVENLVEDILSKESRKKERGKNDLGAVEEALTKILGKEPKKQNRISPDVLETIIELDQFLREEEEERRERVNKAKSLADRAIKLVTGSVEKAKTEKTSLRNVEEDDVDLESLVKSISQDQLRKLFLS